MLLHNQEKFITLHRLTFWSYCTVLLVALSSQRLPCCHSTWVLSGEPEHCPNLNPLIFPQDSFFFTGYNSRRSPSKYLDENDKKEELCALVSKPPESWLVIQCSGHVLFFMPNPWDCNVPTAKFGFTFLWCISSPSLSLLLAASHEPGPQNANPRWEMWCIILCINSLWGNLAPQPVWDAVTKAK